MLTFAEESPAPRERRDFSHTFFTDTHCSDPTNSYDDLRSFLPPALCDAETRGGTLQSGVRILLLLGKGKALPRRAPASPLGRVPRTVHEGIHRGADAAGGDVHMARGRDDAAPLGFLPPCAPPATALCTGEAHQ